MVKKWQKKWFKNGQKTVKNGQNGQNGQNGLEWSKMTPNLWS